MAVKFPINYDLMFFVLTMFGESSLSSARYFGHDIVILVTT